MEEVYTDWKNPKLSNCWTGNKFVRNVNNDKNKISARRISGVSKKEKNHVEVCASRLVQKKRRFWFEYLKKKLVKFPKINDILISEDAERCFS